LPRTRRRSTRPSFDVRADYGPLDKAARGVIDPGRITEHWDDMRRIAVSINAGEVSAHDVIPMISRDGRPTALGEAVAHYGRIFKTLHILRLADDEPYRREGKRQANLTEGRHELACNVFHGRKGRRLISTPLREVAPKESQRQWIWALSTQRFAVGPICKLMTYEGVMGSLATLIG
jgi:Tn3 transposase DDE domain